MESEGGRKKYAKKIFSPPREAPKRKKNQRKDSESKIPSQAIDLEELKQIEEDHNHQNNAVNYVFKLKYQLQATKQKLKAEEERFKHVIKSISAHFGSQDENFSEMLRSAHIFGADNTEEIKADSGFEKLFTTHKYLISDKPHEKLNDNHLETTTQKPRGKKNKESASVTKTTETPNLSAENHIAQNEKSNTKTKKKRSLSIHEDGEEPDKKKKRKKNKNEKENNEVKEVEPTVIPQLSQEVHEIPDDHVDKIKQAEDAINLYQQFAHTPQTYTNKVMEDSLNYLAQQNPEQARLLHQQMFGDMSNIMGLNSMLPGMEMLDQNKLMDELAKMGIQGPMLRAMIPPELANYYQMNNKKCTKLFVVVYNNTV